MSGANEPKGSGTLSITALSRAARYKPEPVSPARQSPEEALRIVLASLDDMKAEDTLSIDLRDKTTIADAMVVTSGRSHRHVGAVADRVFENLEKAGLAGAVELRCGNAVELIPELEPEIDFVLIDLWKDLYVPCLERIVPKLAAGAILVAVVALVLEGLAVLVERWADPMRQARRESA